MTLTERIESLRARSQRVRDVGEWDAIIADVRELEAAANRVYLDSRMFTDARGRSMFSVTPKHIDDIAAALRRVSQ